MGVAAILTFTCIICKCICPCRFASRKRRDAKLCMKHWTKRLCATSKRKSDRLKKFNRSKTTKGHLKKRLKKRVRPLLGMDLFCGTGSMRTGGRAWFTMVSVDIAGNRRYSNRQHFVQGNVLDPDFQKTLRMYCPVFVWASVPCEWFSRARTTGSEPVQNGEEVLGEVINLLRYYRRSCPRTVVVIEDQRGRMRHLLSTMLKDFVLKEASHCQYNEILTFKKDVDLFVWKEHVEKFNFKQCYGYNCKHAYWCQQTNRYRHPSVAQAGSMLRDGERVPGTPSYDDRIRVPVKLCRSAAYQARTILDVV